MLHKLLDVVPNLRNLINVEERRRGRFSVVLSHDGMEDNGEIFARKNRGVQKGVSRCGIGALFKFAIVESIIGKREDRLMRSEVFGQLDDARHIRMVAEIYQSCGRTSLSDNASSHTHPASLTSPNSCVRDGVP